MQVYVGNAAEFCKQESIPLGMESNGGSVHENSGVDCRHKFLIWGAQPHP